VIASGAAVTVIVAVPDTVVYPACVDVAVMIAVVAPVPVGVKVIAVPELTFVVALNVPAEEGLTERFTVFVNAPVPVTVGVIVPVCAVVIDRVVGAIATEVIVGGGTGLTVMVTLAEAGVVPLAPFAMSVYVVVAVGETVTAALQLVVAPLSVQPFVAFVVVGVSVTDCPTVIVVVEAASDAVGAGFVPPQLVVQP
jgi:hypothetical protein